MKTIVHLDMDAFYASIEILRHPELKGKAMVVAGSGPRSVITTASYEARAAYGIGSAMPLAKARRLCPDLIVIPPDFPRYQAVSSEIMSILRAHVDRVEVMGMDEAYLDLSGYMASNATMQGIRAEILEKTGLTCSIGKGPNKLLAKIASGLEKPAGTVSLTQAQARDRFASESPILLPGIGPKTVERLKSIQIQTIAQLSARPVSELQSMLGERHGAFLSHRSQFEDDSELETKRDAKSQSSEITFDFDIADRERQIEALKKLTERLCSRLQARGTAGKNVSIKVRLNDWTTVTRATTLEHPSNDPRVIGPIVIDLLTTYDPSKPVRLLGVRVASFEADGSRKSAGSGGSPRDDQLKLIE